VGFDLLGFLSPSKSTREKAATSAAADAAAGAGVSPEQIETARFIASEKRAGKSNDVIAAELAQRTAKAAGASDQESAAIGAFATASTARPHTLHPCPIADRWFDASTQLAKSYSVPLPSANDWDKYTCREKTQIMAATQLGQGVLGPGGAVVGVALVEAERDAGAVVDAAKATYKNIASHFKF
jgi:hypothetical protein